MDLCAGTLSKSKVSLAVFTLCVLASSYLLLTSFTFSLDITDVSLNNGTVVLTTHQPHHILRWAHPLVTLRDTGVPELDHSPNFGVKATGGKHLELTSSDEEKSWGPFTSTSQGQLGIGFCSFFKAVGLLGLPSLLWLLALLCLAILSSLQAQALMQGLVSLVALLLVLALRVWSPFSGRPTLQGQSSCLGTFGRNSGTSGSPKSSLATLHSCSLHRHSTCTGETAFREATSPKEPEADGL